MQSAVDAMRGIDYLRTRPEVDKNRIALLGGSMGASIGAIVGALDRRLKTVILTVSGLFKEPHDKGPMMLVNNANFIGRISPIPLLMVNAKRDKVFPAEGSKMLFRLAGEPKKQIWYNEGHYLAPEKYNRDIMKWLKEYLRK